MYSIYLLSAVIFRLLVNVDSWYTPGNAESASTGTQYILMLDKFSWEEGYEACTRIGAVLARVDSYYVHYLIEEFVANEWDGLWHDIWFGLYWTTAPNTGNRPLRLWSDKCDELQDQWYANFKDRNEAQFKDSELCYKIRGGDFKWERRSCGDSYNVLCERRANYTSETGPYDRVNVGLLATNISNSSVSDCKDLCDAVYGCFVTSYYGSLGCILGVSQHGAETFIKVNRSTADVHKFTSDEITEIEVAAQTASYLTACPRPPENSTDHRPYLDVINLNPLELPYCGIAPPDSTACIPTPSSSYFYTTTTETFTTTHIITSSEIVYSSFEPLSSCNPDPTPCSSVIIFASPSSVPPCVPTATAFNLSEEEQEAVVQSIIQELSINVRRTRKALSKFSSADDGRTSAQTMGYVSITFICIALFIIFAMDVPILYIGLRSRVFGE